MKTSLTDIVRKTSASLLCIATLNVISARVATAASFVDYLTVPASGTLSPSGVGPENFNLPGYGPVGVSLTQITGSATATFVDQTQAYGQTTSNGNYTWGTDTQRFDIYNTSGSTEKYTFNFQFLNGVPDANRLVFVVDGLAYGTTAQVPSPVGTFVGEYTFPSGSYAGGPSSTTHFDSGTGTFSSNDDGDPVNTGWALYQIPPGLGLTNFSLTVDQVPGDGVGFTVGYTTPEPSSLACLVCGVAILGLRRARSAKA